MLYEAKKGTKTYEYINSILEAEFEEYKAYMKRVHEAVDVEFQKYKGYQPNGSLLREHEIIAIWVPAEQYDTMDKKLWRKVDSTTIKNVLHVAVMPNKRYKWGKRVDAILSSYKPVTNHWKLLKALNVKEPASSSFSITQLLSHKDRIFAFFDDSIRAEKCNPDFKEITIGEYEDLINSDKEG